VPSVTRVFSSTRPFYVYLQAYERNAEQMHPLVAFVSLYRDGAKVRDWPPQAIVDGMHPRSKAVPLRFEISLGNLAPGPYDCQVTVLDTTDQKAAFWRAPMAIVP
jgi:hypothetical protein